MNNNTNKEVWKDIEGYEGLYKVSSRGRVWSCRRNKFMSTRVSRGYLLTKLSNNGKQKTIAVHRLVAKAFIPNPENKPEVNHKDENKLNNHANNLMWATSRENANWGTRNKRIAEYVKANPVKLNGKIVFKTKRIKQIDPKTNKVISVYNSVSEASRLNNFHQGNISSCLTGNRNFASGYKWEYVD